jgi:putative cardiolipin synthase
LIQWNKIPGFWLPARKKISARVMAGLAAMLATALLVGCASLPPAGPRQASAAIINGAETSLGRLAAKGAPKDAPSMSGFRLLPEAGFAFEARVALMRHAERSIDMQYYLIRNDDAGLLLLKELRDAAARGVRVRLLVDDLYAGGEDQLFAALDAFPLIEVRYFNPLPSRSRSLPLRLAFSFFDLLRVNHRMHNKLLVADNSWAISGGRNIGNEYFMRHAAANFIDLDVLSTGPVVQDMSRSFDQFWNSDQVRPAREIIRALENPEVAQKQFNALVQSAVPDMVLRERDILGNPPVGQQILQGAIECHWARARFFSDIPQKLDLQHDVAYLGSVSEGALNSIAAANREVKILTPYFVPGPQGMAILDKFVSTGGRVVLVTNSLGSTDEPLAYAGYERYRAEMLRIGITVYELAPHRMNDSERFKAFGKSISRLHAKVAILDDDKIFIGSMNLDHRSAAINTELGLLIESAAMVKEFNTLIAAEHLELSYRLQLSADGRRTQWVSRTSDGSRIVDEDVPGEFFWLRLKNWLVLPILGEELL